MKQTAVEWLLSELQVRLLTIKSEPDGFVRETMINNFLIDTEQAKEMEKQQIIDAYHKGQIGLVEIFVKSFEPEDEPVLNDKYDAKLYYNETFKK